MWEKEREKNPLSLAIKSSVLLYSTENCVQYPMINHNGKEYVFKKNVSICITESLCCTAIIKTTL